LISTPLAVLCDPGSRPTFWVPLRRRGEVRLVNLRPNGVEYLGAVHSGRFLGFTLQIRLCEPSSAATLSVASALVPRNPDLKRD
jgi:hypothetical protein